jgi:hypothetical protein
VTRLSGVAESSSALPISIQFSMSPILQFLRSRDI